MWKFIRISILLLILAVVAQQAFLEKQQLNWRGSFTVAVYPINADQSEVTARYLKTLKAEDFKAVEDFMAKEAKRYGLTLRAPIRMVLGPEVLAIPPEPPQTGEAIDAIIWSLKLRYFTWMNSPSVHVKPKIRLYLLYFNPHTHASLTHSTAMQKGRIGRINLFAGDNQAKQNLVILTHELLHTLNASDKYSFGDNQPSYPEGYAEPTKQPLLPQNMAEIMGGRIPVSATEAHIPESLEYVIIGEKTAEEIGWR